MTVTRTKVAVATTSALAADAAREVAEGGGNAVDCAIAAAMCSINTQPGVCALAGSAFVTVWPAGGDPVTIDGNVAIPGMGRSAREDGPAVSVTLDYGGGIRTIVGPSSVAVPGTPAALELAAGRYGSLPWKTLLAPSVRAAREGFPLAAACHYYLGYSGESIYGRSDDGFRSLHDADGRLLDAGAPVRVPHLADSLQLLADEGAAVFYRGDIAARLVGHIQEGGGRLGAADLAAYEAIVRPCLSLEVGGWQVATNPPPAIGGVNLAAMLLDFGTGAIPDWTNRDLSRLVRTQRAVIEYRRKHLDGAIDVDEAAVALLEQASRGALPAVDASGSTVHTSATDESGLACAITASSGYGSGEMPPGTGLWLNNCLGELELNPRGLAVGPPGARLPSNMAPGAARHGRAVLAFGSPGADRITTATHQFLVNFLQRRDDLDTAIRRPRVHVRIGDALTDLAAEPGLDLPRLDLPVHVFDAPSMYFGGVVAALRDAEGRFHAAADPRREGGIFVTT